MRFSDFILENQPMNELDAKQILKKAKEKLQKLFRGKEPPKKEEIKKAASAARAEVSKVEDDEDYEKIAKDLISNYNKAIKKMEQTAIEYSKISDPKLRAKEFQNYKEDMKKLGSDMRRADNLLKKAGKESNNWSKHVSKEQDIDSKVMGKVDKSKFAKEVSNLIKSKKNVIVKASKEIKDIYVSSKPSHHYAREFKDGEVLGGDVKIDLRDESGKIITNSKIIGAAKEVVCSKVIKEIINKKTCLYKQSLAL